MISTSLTSAELQHPVVLEIVSRLPGDERRGLLARFDDVGDAIVVDAATSYTGSAWATTCSRNRGTEIAGGAQIDPVADDELLELHLHARHVEEAHAAIGFELDQEVDVAVGREVVAQRTAEHREATNAVAAAEQRRWTHDRHRVG